MAPHSRLGAAIGWLALSLLHGTGSLFADGLSNYGAFGKWTFTASTPEMAKKSLDFAVKYLNLLPIVRNTSKDDYLLIGPTGCDKVKRAWGAERFLVGDNQYHWVWDRHADPLPETELSIEYLHQFMTSINSDLRDDWNECVPRSRSSSRAPKTALTPRGVRVASRARPVSLLGAQVDGLPLR